MFRTSPPQTHAGREALEAWRAGAHLASARWQTCLDADSTTRGFAFASYLAALDAEEAAADVAALAARDRDLVHLRLEGSACLYQNSTKGAGVLANPPLQEAVIASLERDTRIPEPLTIAVSAQGNVVTLRGKVETFRQRHAALDDARQVDGVQGIDDQLQVELRPMDHREDDEIRAAALQKLIRDSEVPDDSIEVRVRNGWVTLSGYVEYEPQRVAAYDDVATVDGVMAISNEIKLLGY